MPEQMLRELEDFEALCRDRFGIRLGESNAWKGLTASFLDLMSAFGGELPNHPDDDWRDRARAAMGVFDLAAKANCVSAHSDLPVLEEHVELFLSAKGLIQNEHSPVDDQDSNKLFELLVALVAMQFCETIEVDLRIPTKWPTQSDGSGPGSPTKWPTVSEACGPSLGAKRRWRSVIMLRRSGRAMVWACVGAWTLPSG
jgi:hypothetical protein